MSSKRRKACEGKIRYAEMKDSWKAVCEAKAHRRQILNAYKCVFCNGWHIGHPPRNVRRAMKAGGAI